MANTTKKANTYVPPSAERKLQKQLTSIKKQMFTLSPDVEPYTVKSDPRLGDYVVMVLGSSSSPDYVQQVVLHRLIGRDHTISPDEDWVMSNAGDIPGFFTAEAFPGEKKVLEKLSQYQSTKAAERKAINLKSGVEFYPDSGKNRMETLNLARQASAAHAKVKGGAHFGEWILYLSPDDLKEEIRYLSAIHDHKEDEAEKVAILKELVYFQTALVDGRKQKVVPHMRGVPKEGLLKHILHLVASGHYPSMPEQAYQVTNKYVPFKTYKDYDPGTPLVRETLVRDLKVHSEAFKAVNIAKSDLAKAKDKAQAAEISAVLEHKMEELSSAASTIFRTEKLGKYPTITTLFRHEMITTHDRTKATMVPKEETKVATGGVAPK